MSTEGNTANLGQSEDVLLYGGATRSADLRIGETVVAVPSLEVRVSGLLAGRDTAEEGDKGSIQSVRHILQDLSIDVAVLWTDLFDGGKLC